MEEDDDRYPMLDCIMLPKMVVVDTTREDRHRQTKQLRAWHCTLVCDRFASRPCDDRDPYPPQEDTRIAWLARRGVMDCTDPWGHDSPVEEVVVVVVSGSNGSLRESSMDSSCWYYYYHHQWRRRQVEWLGEECYDEERYRWKVLLDCFRRR